MPGTDFRKARFLQSAQYLRQCPDDTGAEIAFAGRSNAGKSSAINTLCEQKKLARTSKTPGRTQLLNFFTVGDTQRLVDLPGFGYAKVSKSTRSQWQKNLDEYLRKRQSLIGLVLLSDIRHPLQEFDLSMLEWGHSCELPTLVLLTKADKLKFGAAKASLLQVEKRLQAYPLASAQLFSSLKRTGVDEARKKLTAWLDQAGQ